MSGTTEAFSLGRINAPVMDAGRNPTDGSSVLFGHVLAGGTRSSGYATVRRPTPETPERSRVRRFTGSVRTRARWR